MKYFKHSVRTEPIVSLICISEDVCYVKYSLEHQNRLTRMHFIFILHRVSSSFLKAKTPDRRSFPLAQRGSTSKGKGDCMNNMQSPAWWLQVVSSEISM